MRKVLNYFKNRRERTATNLKRKELEKKAVEGAEKAVKEYRRVFERLAEYDRT